MSRSKSPRTSNLTLSSPRSMHFRGRRRPTSRSKREGLASRHQLREAAQLRHRHLSRGATLLRHLGLLRLGLLQHLSLQRGVLQYSRHLWLLRHLSRQRGVLQYLRRHLWLLQHLGRQRGVLQHLRRLLRHLRGFSSDAASASTARSSWTERHGLVPRRGRRVDVIMCSC